MKLDGTMAEMHEKWFGVKPAAGSAAVTVFPGYGVPGMDGHDPDKPHTPKCKSRQSLTVCRAAQDRSATSRS